MAVLLMVLMVALLFSVTFFAAIGIGCGVYLSVTYKITMWQAATGRLRPLPLSRLCLCTLTPHNPTLHTMLVTCTCCYDLTKGTQDKDFSYSLSDSLSRLCEDCN